MAVEPFLHVSGDAFLEMIAPQLWGDPEGIVFRQFDEDGLPSVEIELGVQLDRLMNGMRASVAALAKAGNHCVVDDVMLASTDQQHYFEVCSGLPLQFVAIHAPLNILEERERVRGNRLLGLARWQFLRVHRDIEYDFEIDTSVHNSQETAKAIATALGVSMSNS